MTEAEEEQRKMALSKCGGVCEVCGKQLTYSTWQGAHRIANTEANRAKWGNWIIDSHENIAIVCSLKCNQVCNVGYSPGKCLEIVERVLNREKLKWK